MEAWLAELEMDIGVLFNQSQPQHNTAMETTFDEQWEDFPYPLSAAESNTSSPQLDFDYNNLIEQLSPPDNNYSHSNDNHNYNNNDEISILNTNTQDNRNIGGREGKMKQHEEDALQSSGSNGEVQVQDNARKMSNKTDATKPSGSGGPKRKREPSQVQDHIMAERRRRELLSQRFIALSAIVPGLKKTDKTSVLGESIKYLKQLQEKVKVLEEAAAKRTVESVLVIKKSQLVFDDDRIIDDNNSSCTVEENAVSREAVDHNANDSLPQFEIKVSGKSFLLRVCCEKRKGNLARLIAEIEKHDLSIVNTSIIPFGSLALDITIVAQKENEFNTSVKDLVRSVRSALLLTSHRCHQRSNDHQNL